MRISFLSDSNWEAKIDHAIRVLDLRAHFEEKSFGEELSALVIVLNCRDPLLGHKRRVRRVRESGALYVDVMLDLSQFVGASHVLRRQMIFDQTRIQLSDVLQGRKFHYFQADALLGELLSVMNEQLNGPYSTRFDVYCLERVAVGIDREM